MDRKRTGERSTKKPLTANLAGPHHNLQHDQVRATIEGPCLHDGGSRVVVAIQDGKQKRWAVYPDADPKRAIWVSGADMARFACSIMVAEIARLGVSLTDLAGGAR